MEISIDSRHIDTIRVPTVGVTADGYPYGFVDANGKWSG